MTKLHSLGPCSVGDKVSSGTTIVDEGGFYIAQARKPEHAAQIVKALNCHDDLVEALKEIFEVMGSRMDEGFEKAKAALAKAGV